MNDKYEIRDLQLKLLEIIDYFDKICKENGIEYYLCAGSVIGAVRHKGFIPWDDDFDVSMTWDNYIKFVKVCESSLDTDRFYFEREQSKYWPLCFSKLKMNNTEIIEGDYIEGMHLGIYIDIFTMENIPSSKIKLKWQYICGRIAVAQTIAKRGYKKAPFKKKIIMNISNIFFNNKLFDKYFINQARKYNNINTKFIGFLFNFSKFSKIVFDKNIFGKAKYLEFEGRMLPVPQKYHEYLTLIYGDYMKYPPKEEQLPKHIAGGLKL